MEVVDRMTRAALAPSVFAAVIALASPATADEMQDQISRALRWVDQNSEYKNTPPPRGYSVVSAEEMQGKSANWGGSGTATAMYLCASQTVLLRDTFNPKKIYDFSVLVHEMTHHAQCVNGRASSNHCEKEREAYEVQWKYIEKNATENRDRLSDVRKMFDDAVARQCRR